MLLLAPLNIKNCTIRTVLITWGLLFFLVQSRIAKGQEFIYREKIINIFQNNFNRDINCIDFDKKGFLWVGTNAGLYRHDGYNTDPLTFYNKDSFQNNLSINDLIFNGNNLYVATNQGLFVVETHKKNYTTFPISELYRVPITKLYADDESGIWCLTETGLIAHKTNNQLKIIRAGMQFKNNNTIITENKQYIFISLKDNRLIIINKKNDHIEQDIIFKNFEYTTGLTRNPKNNVYITTNKGTYEIILTDGTMPKLIPHTEFGNDVNMLIYVANHFFIYRNDGNIYHTYTKNGELKSIKITINQDNNLIISGIRASKNQLAFPGRAGLGLVEITPKYINTLIKINNVDNGDTRGITEDSTYYYLCTYKNIFRLNKISGKTEIISSQHLITHGIYRENDTLWIASEAKGLIRFNLKTFQTDIIYDATERYRSTICVKPLNRDTLIIGAYNCILLYNKKTRKLSELLLNEKDKKYNIKGYFRDIHIIDKNNFIIASEGGIFKIDINGKILYEYNKENSNCIWMNEKKQIWAGTSNGLILIDSNGKFITKLTSQNGLPGNKIASITPDHLGNLWIGTYSGLSCVSIADLAIRNYYTKDGLPDNEFNHSSIFVDNKKNILMGTMKGFIQFKPSNNNIFQKTTSTILISKIEKQINGLLESEILTNVEKLDLIKLGKNINYINLYFCNLPISFFSENRYTYKILKVISQNIDISKKPMITLLDTEPGKFDLEVEMNNGNGTNGLYNKIVSYKVLQYFYLNKWFYITTSLFFMILIIGYLYILLDQKNKNIQIRTEIARDLHDEIGGSLTAISLYTELLRENTPPTAKQIKSIQNTTRRLILSFRDALWTLNTQSDSALELWDHLKDMVSDIAGNLEMNIQFEEIEDLDKINFSLKTKQNLLLALKEGINNAIKHGDNGFLTIKWMKEKEKHLIIISNSAILSKTNNRITLSNGIGLNSMQKRMNDIGGKIKFETNNQFFNVIYHLNFIK